MNGLPRHTQDAEMYVVMGVPFFRDKCYVLRPNISENIALLTLDRRHQAKCLDDRPRGHGVKSTVFGKAPCHVIENLYCPEYGLLSVSVCLGQLCCAVLVLWYWHVARSSSQHNSKIGVSTQ